MTSEIDRVVHQGVIVAGDHGPVIWRGTCLTCGQPDYTPGCDGVTPSPAGFDIPAPLLAD